MSTKLYLVVSSNDDGTKTVDGIYSSILKADASVEEGPDAHGKMIFTVPVNEIVPARLGSLVFNAPVFSKATVPILKNPAVAAQAAVANGEYETVPAGL